MAWANILKAGVAALCVLAAAAPSLAQRGRSVSGVGVCAPVSRAGLLAESAPGRVAFDGGVERVMLVPACGGSLSDKVRRSEGRRFILLVDDLRARRASGAVFSLRLSEAAGGEGDEAVLGSLNFFAARAPEATGSQRRVSYDVTGAVTALAQAGRLERGLTVLLRPSEPPAPGAELSVARLQLVVQ